MTVDLDVEEVPVADPDLLGDRDRAVGVAEAHRAVGLPLDDEERGGRASWSLGGLPAEIDRERPAEVRRQRADELERLLLLVKCAVRTKRRQDRAAVGERGLEDGVGEGRQRLRLGVSAAAGSAAARAADVAVAATGDRAAASPRTPTAPRRRASRAGGAARLGGFGATHSQRSRTARERPAATRRRFSILGYALFRAPGRGRPDGTGGSAGGGGTASQRSAAEAVALDRLARVHRAGRLEAAGARQKRREEALVEVEERRRRQRRRAAHRRGSRDSARVTPAR